MPSAPLRLRPHGLQFAELRELREYLGEVLEGAPASLRHFQETYLGGFVHQGDKTPDPDDPFSKASTATCVAFLAAAGQLPDLVPKDKWGALKDKIVDGEVSGADKGRWTSADLPADNPFTVAFLLDAIYNLDGTDGLSVERKKKVEGYIEQLEEELAKTGGLSISKYDPTAFLTFKAYRVLKKWQVPKDNTTETVRTWVWDHLASESVLIASGSPDADVFELAYSVLTASAAARFNEMTPQERWKLRFALGQFFDAQSEEDGLWPRSRPLFLYPNLGYAYCFDYELLASMLADDQVAPIVFERLGGLRRAGLTLDDRRFQLTTKVGDSDVYGWSSGHHGRQRKAESWATASVFHFCHELDRVGAEAIRREVFEYVGATAAYLPPKSVGEISGRIDRKQFLDSEVAYKTHARSLTDILDKRFLAPLVAGRDAVAHGRELPKSAPLSAILYGPPGTAKTSVADLIAKALGWPLLSIDPSHLTRQGLDQVHAEADALFGRLGALDEVVVLLDEFDELVRERSGEGEYQSRFLTTAMLPKLQGLSNRRRVVYLIATNHPEQFDAAIRRPGRFDVILPVMPPTLEAKRSGWSVLATALDTFKGEGRSALDEYVADMTYSETQELVAALPPSPKAETVKDVVTRLGKRATMRQKVSNAGGAPDWKTQLAAEQDRIRVLNYDLSQAP